MNACAGRSGLLGRGKQIARCDHRDRKLAKIEVIEGQQTHQEAGTALEADQFLVAPPPLTSPDHSPLRGESQLTRTR